MIIKIFFLYDTEKLVHILGIGMHIEAVLAKDFYLGNFYIAYTYWWWWPDFLKTLVLIVFVNCKSYQGSH